MATLLTRKNEAKWVDDSTLDKAAHTTVEDYKMILALDQTIKIYECPMLATNQEKQDASGMEKHYQINLMAMKPG